MASTRIAFGIGFAAATLGLVMACSSSTSGSSSGTSGTSGGTSGSTSGIKSCGSSQTASKCTAAELQPYSDCVQTNCASAYTECYGADYKNGNFSGPCGTYITCANACACEDTACRMKCSLDSACTTCLTGKASTCSQGCTIPACATAGSSGTSGTSGTTGKTCAQLAACCATQTGSAQMACQGAYDAIKNNGDATCNAAYSTYCPGGA